MTVKTADMVDDEVKDLITSEVFRFPDGNGGWVLKRQDEDGSWKECDGTGTILGKGPEDPARKDSPQKGKRASSSGGSPSGGQSRKMSIFLHREDYETINRYCAWLSFRDGRTVSRSELIVRAVMRMIRSDAAFKAFIKRQTYKVNDQRA